MKRVFIFPASVVFVGVFGMAAMHISRANKGEVETLSNPAVQRVVSAWDELATPPTVGQLQQMLVMRGYDIRIDGRLGPETVRAWQQWECDQAAQRAMEAADE